MDLWLVVAGIAGSCCMYFLCSLGVTLLLRRTAFGWMKSSSVIDLSNKMVTCVHSLIVATAGFLIVMNTRHDFMHGRHALTNPIAVMCTGYQLYDLWIMFYIFDSKTDLSARDSIANRILNFMRAHPAIVAHHLWIILIGFPTVIWWRKGAHDFVAGAIYLQDASTPFICFRSILTQIGASGGYLYAVTTIATAVVFFLCRICMFPLVLYAYAKYADMPLLHVPFSIPKYCSVMFLGDFILQLHWCFILQHCARKALRVMSD